MESACVPFFVGLNFDAKGLLTVVAWHNGLDIRNFPFKLIKINYVILQNIFFSSGKIDFRKSYPQKYIGEL